MTEPSWSSVEAGEENDEEVLPDEVYTDLDDEEKDGDSDKSYQEIDYPDEVDEDGDHEDERRFKKKLKRMVHPAQLESVLEIDDDDRNLIEWHSFGDHISNAAKYIKQILVFSIETRKIRCAKPAELWDKVTPRMCHLLDELFRDQYQNSFSISNNIFQGTRRVCLKQTSRIVVAVVFGKQMTHEECDHVIKNAVDIYFTRKCL